MSGFSALTSRLADCKPCSSTTLQRGSVRCQWAEQKIQSQTTNINNRRKCQNREIQTYMACSNQVQASSRAISQHNTTGKKKSKMRSKQKTLNRSKKTKGASSKSNQIQLCNKCHSKIKYMSDPVKLSNMIKTVKSCQCSSTLQITKPSGHAEKALMGYSMEKKISFKPVKTDSLQLLKDSDAAMDIFKFFKDWRISKETVVDNEVMQDANNVAYVYEYGHHPALISYHDSIDEDIPCEFTYGCQPLYGVDDAIGKEELIVADNELSYLAIKQTLGKEALQNIGVVALPPHYREWLDRQAGKEVFRFPKKVVLALRQDQAMVEEFLAKRTGRTEQFYTIDWARGFKDVKNAAECLRNHGQDVLARELHNAKAYTEAGTQLAIDYLPAVFDVLFPPDDQCAVTTGIASLDEYYTVVPGEVTLVTGLPNTGKSNFLDCLVSNLAKIHGHKIGMCSMEKRVSDHYWALIETVAGVGLVQPLKVAGDRLRAVELSKRKFPAQAGSRAVIQKQKEIQEAEKCVEGLIKQKTCEILTSHSREFTKAQQFVEQHMLLTQPPLQGPSVPWLHKRIRVAHQQHGIKGYVIDPYNMIDAGKVAKETEFVRQLMGGMSALAKELKIHIWIVAHPRKMTKVGSQELKYSVSGSAHWLNITDNLISIARPEIKELQKSEDDEDGTQQEGCEDSGDENDDVIYSDDDDGGQMDPERFGETVIQVEKVRQKSTGGLGTVTVAYDRETRTALDSRKESIPDYYNKYTAGEGKVNIVGSAIGSFKGYNASVGVGYDVERNSRLRDARENGEGDGGEGSGGEGDGNGEQVVGGVFAGVGGEV